MEDNTFWITIWKLVALVICVIVLTISGCSINSGLVAERLVKSGADPIKVRCMLMGTDGYASSIICHEAAKK